MGKDRIVFGKNVDRYRKNMGLSMEELGRRLNKDKSTISRWVKGERFPKIEEAEEIADFFNVSFETLIYGERDAGGRDITTIYNELEPPRQKKVYSFAESQLEEQNKVINLEDYRTIKLQSKLSAGTGIIDLDPYYVEEIDYKGYVPEHDLAFQVSGDSMEPMFKDSEIIFVEKTSDIRTGQIVAVQINEEAFIKKAYIEDECLRLVSLNKAYDDIIADINDDIRIIGRVIL